MDGIRQRVCNQSALLIVDMITDWSVKDGRRLLQQAIAVLPALSALARRARANDVPVIYANDNFGHWQSDLSALLEQTRQAHPLSEKIVKELAPLPSDFVVLKPAHSAFFQAPLEKLLEHLEVGRLVIGGVSGDQCVLATSSDALMRGFEVVVPRTVIASPTAARNKRVLAHFRTAMDIPTPDARSIRWSRS